MTVDQLKALNAIRTTHSYSNYNGTKFGTYQTEDITTLLSLVDEQDQMLKAVMEDLKDTISLLTGDSRSDGTLGMLNSTLALLEVEGSYEN